MSIVSNDVKAKWLFGSTVPFAEPAWARCCPSPYYNDSHRRLRAAMRLWVEEVTTQSSLHLWLETCTLTLAEPIAPYSGMGAIPVAPGFTLRKGS